METIGSIRLVRRLGAGSFATVWLGQDTAHHHHPVAVKILAENWSDNEDVRNRFLAEARLMNRINDERIVRVHSLGVLPDSRPYFVMDYCNAGSLNDRRRSPGDPLETLRLCAEACRALDVLHRHRVVHRDVTPGNLLLQVNDQPLGGAPHLRAGMPRVRLADLGVAKELIGQQGVTMTAGTPAFMAPEQATGRPLGAHSDIYALACVTYAVLTGDPPFPVKSVQDVMLLSAESVPPPLADRIGAPPDLDRLLQAALSVDPARRPASAEAMGIALHRIADAMAPARGGFAEATRVVPPSARIAAPDSPASHSSPAPFRPTVAPPA
ncbi:MAG: serine/threonine-protein kinase, partial [Propionibacteriaceae bacterium]|nr:serine/threonine-protein kinase [Propionibacteriaceae bacterium]